MLPIPDGSSYLKLGIELHNLSHSDSPSVDNSSALKEIITKLKNGEYSPFCLLSAYNSLIATQNPKTDEITSQIAFQILNHPIKSSESNAENTSPRIIRNFLQNEGILPMAEEAKSVFWALGEFWWLSIIDGKYGHFGPLVFDQGLHGGVKEPGYLEGIKKGSEYLSSHLDKKLDLNLYMKVHEIASQHVTLNIFRTEEISARSPFPTDLNNYNLKCINYFEKLDRDIESYISLTTKNEIVLNGLEFQEFDLPSNDELIEKYKKRMSDIKNWLINNISPNFKEKTDKEIRLEVLNIISQFNERLTNETGNYLNKINTDVNNICTDLSLNKPFMECYSEGSSFKICYFAHLPDQAQAITEQILNKFNGNLESLQKEIYDKTLLAKASSKESLLQKAQIKKEYQERAAQLISSLYAQLEWLHPWIDGQGRTDLILLNCLLCREGLHPSILKEPYYSTTHSTEEWNAYLKEGLRAYDEKFHSLH